MKRMEQKKNKKPFLEQPSCNSLEGVITKKFKRYGSHKSISLPETLKNIADYLDAKLKKIL